MGSLMQSLGLNSVSANVNDIEDGKYDATVEKSEAFFNKAKNTVSHVITYRITFTDPVKGKVSKTAQEFFKLGENPVDANGNFAENEESLAGYNNTQTEQNKSFHKKRFVDLLATNDKADKERVEAQVDAGQLDFKDLVGAECVVTLKTKDGFQNVSAAYKRSGSTATPTATNAVSLGGNVPATQPTQTPESQVTPPTGIQTMAGGL